MYNRFGFVANWPPAAPLQLGMIGVMEQNVFVPRSSLSETSVRIPFNVTEEGAKQDISYRSSSSIDVLFKARGTPVPPDSALVEAKAGVVIDFKGKSGVLFEARECVMPVIADQLSLGDTIIDRYRSGHWAKNWVVVTQIIKADSIAVLISGNNGGRLELTAESDLQLGSLPLANAALNLKCVRSFSMHTEILGHKGAAPLFRVSGIKPRWFRRPIFGIRLAQDADDRSPADTPRDELDFGPLDLKFDTEEAS